MAWIVGDGFDYYGALADVGRSVWDAVQTGGLSLSTTTRFGVGQSIRWDTTIPPFLQRTMSTNEATIFLAFAFYQDNALGGVGTGFNLQLKDGATTQCSVIWQPDGAIVVRLGGTGGTVLATFPAAFAQTVWTHFQVRVVIHPTAGTVTIRKNGAASDTFTATGLNTRSSANSYANVIVLSSSMSITPKHYSDDVLLYSGSGAAPNDWVGDIRAITLMPSADTAVKQFAVFPSGTNAGAVDEALANSDTDYVFDSVVGHEDLYAMADLPVTPAAVIGVVSKVFIKKSDAGARSGMLRTRSGATDANGADTVLSSTYTYLSRVDTVDPATGVAWTPAGVNALQIGQKVTA
jgi:hypothetical protein